MRKVRYLFSFFFRFIDLHGGTVGMKPVEGGGLEVTCWLPVKVTKSAQPQDLLLTESVPA